MNWFKVAVVGLAVVSFAASALIPQTATQAVQGLSGLAGLLVGWLVKFPDAPAKDGAK